MAIRVQIIGDSSSLERAFRRSGKAADHFGRKMARLGSKTGGRAIRAAGIGGAAGGTGIAVGGVVAGVASVKAAAQFEKSMSRIEGLAGQSRAQVAKWSDQLLALGPSLGKGPQELAEALYFVASSGVPAAKAISVVTAAAKASEAGLGETQVVADAVTSVMNAYASSNMSAAQATDVLVATVREGKGEASAFAGVIGNVAAFASRLKVPFEEVGASLAAMTQLGTDPATAATQLNAFFSQLVKPAPKAEKALASVGLSFDQLNETLRTKGLLATLDQIKVAFGGNTAAMAQAFPNVRALRALFALTADDGGKVAGVFERMRNSSGSMASAFAASQGTAENAINQFKASVDALKIAFGQGLLPVVTAVVTKMAGWLANPENIAKVREWGVVVGEKLYGAFQAISGWFEAHWADIKSALTAGWQVAKVFAGAVARVANAFKKIASFTPGGEGTLLGMLLGGVLLTKLLPVAAVLWKILRRFRLIASTSAAGMAGGAVGGKGGKGKGAGKLTKAAKFLGPVGLAAAVGESDFLKQKAIDLGIRSPDMSKEDIGAAIRKRTGMGGGIAAKIANWQRMGAQFTREGNKVRVTGPGGQVYNTFDPGEAGYGKAMTIAGDVHLHGVQDVQQFMGEMQRFAKTKGSQTRGRQAGNKLAFG